MHYNGSTWEPVTVTGGGFIENIVQIYGATPDDVWALGDDGTVFRNSGQGFVASEDMPARISSLAGTAADDIWLVGSLEHGLVPALYRTDGVVVNIVEMLMRPIHMQDDGEMLRAIDSSGVVWRLDGAWQKVAAGFDDTNDYLVDAVFSGPSEAFGINQHDQVFRWDGSDWLPGGLNTMFMQAIERTCGQVFVVGSLGRVARRQN